MLLRLLVVAALLGAGARGQDADACAGATIYSYHIHVLFVGSDAASVAAARALLANFTAAFNLSATPPCPGVPGDPWNAGDNALCLFDLRTEPGAWRHLRQFKTHNKGRRSAN
jgi:hypothetical protein